jgi:hypothetical protein
MISTEPGALIWRKSSFSNGADACVEVAWRKSSFSNGSSACVEVAPVASGVAVRDSKHPTGPTLTFDLAGWRACAATR